MTLKHEQSAFSKAMGNMSRKQVAGLPADRRLVKRAANALIRQVRENQGVEFSTPQTAKNRRSVFKACFMVIGRNQQIV